MLPTPPGASAAARSSCMRQVSTRALCCPSTEGRTTFSAVKLRKTLTGTALVFVMFFNVSGGAYSTEGLAGSVGPGLALLALLIVPLVWSLPETLIVGELASMLPEEGGYYRWVRRAFGEFWALPERMGDVAVLARRHGDLSGAVQPVPAMVLPVARRRQRVDRGARRDLGRDGDQPARRVPRGPRVGLGRVVRAAGVPRAGAVREFRTRSTRPGRRSRTRASTFRAGLAVGALDRALELHRVGQREHGAGGGDRRVAQLSPRAAGRAAARDARLLRPAASGARRERRKHVAGRFVAIDRDRRSRAARGRSSPRGSRSADW